MTTRNQLSVERASAPPNQWEGSRFIFMWSSIQARAGVCKNDNLKFSRGFFSSVVYHPVTPPPPATAGFGSTLRLCLRSKWFRLTF